MSPAYYYNQGGGAPNPAQTMQMPPRGIPGQMGLPQAHFLQQQQQAQQAPFRQPSMNDPNLHRKRAHSKTSRPSAPLTDEADEPSGDELDDISARDIAMARYKRNHDYLSEIFTPYNAASIVPPPLDINQTKEEFTKLIDEHERKAVEQKKSHDEKLMLLKQQQKDFWKLMNDLNQANTLESIDSTCNELQKEMKVELEHRKDTKSVSLPGLEEDDEEEQKVEEQKLEPEPVDFMQFDDDKNETNDMDMFFEQRETNDSNDFFSEMVNTEDDPSVSEFLADMTE